MMSQNEVEILLVEDDPDDVALTLHALKGEHLCNRIEVARDGEEALDFLFCRAQFAGRDPRSNPKLILLDLKLPKVDGLEVLRQIKGEAATRSIPVVILTSSRQEADLVRSYALGTNSYIQKPVDFDQFRSTIKQLGYYWLLVNQTAPKDCHIATLPTPAR
jgi:two-component system, response regulator